MKMKKLIVVFALCAVFVVGALSLTACKTQLGDLNVDTDYTKFPVAENYNAYDMLQSLYSQWTGDSYYRYETFHFEATALGLGGERNTQMINKVTPDYVFYQQYAVGTGLAAINEAERYYFDKNGAQKGIFIEKKLSYDSKKGEMTLKNGWSDWKDYAREEPISERVANARGHLTTYIFDTRDCLSEKHDDKVYFDKNTGTYYFTITFDCSDEKMNGLQTEARDEFIHNTGAENEGFGMEQDTTLQVRAREIAGVMRMIYFCRTEKYFGKKKVGGLIDVKAQQQCISVFDYDSAKYALSADEKA